MEALALLLPLLLLLRAASSRDVKGEFFFSANPRLMNKVSRFMAETFNVHV
jgi:hypothetical protein